MFKRVAIAVAVVMSGMAAMPMPAAHAARGFSWIEPPHIERIADFAVIEATWHANFADPRCPMTDHLDERPGDHKCFGTYAEIGIPFGDFLIVHGSDNANVPSDDYTDRIWGECVPDEGPGGGEDWWIAIWHQDILHEAGHHQPQPNAAPVVKEEDIRISEEARLSRCAIGQMIIDDPFSPGRYQ